MAQRPAMGVAQQARFRVQLLTRHLMRLNPTTCGGHSRYTRRHFLFGAASAALLRVHADAEPTASRPAVRTANTARACIFINMNGGPSHLDTFDAKAGPWSPPDLDLVQHPGGLVMSRKFFPKLSTMPQDILALRSC